MSVEDEAAKVVEQTDLTRDIRNIAKSSTLAAVQAARLWGELSMTVMPPELIQMLVMQAAAHFWAAEFAECSGHTEDE